MNNDLMFSSKTDLWATPQAFFDKLHAVFRFETDVCALPDNAKCATYYTPDKNGLAQDWKGTCWMNPPYGREIAAWVQKAYRSAKENGATVVCLLPARVDTRWWHDYCANGEVFFVRGRLKFGGAENSAPFPNAVVVFRPTVHDALKVGAGVAERWGETHDSAVTVNARNAGGKIARGIRMRSNVEVRGPEAALSPEAPASPPGSAAS